MLQGDDLFWDVGGVGVVSSTGIPERLSPSSVAVISSVFRVFQQVTLLKCEGIFEDISTGKFFKRIFLRLGVRT